MIFSMLMLLALALAAVSTGILPTFTEDISRAVNVSYFLRIFIHFGFSMVMMINPYNTLAWLDPINDVGLTFI